MTELENWCNEKGLSSQQKVEIKKQFSKHGGGTEAQRDRSLFKFLSKKSPEELAKSNYVFASATMGPQMGKDGKQEKAGTVEYTKP